MRTLLFALLPALVGCGDIFGNKDAHQPGTLLGTYHVVSTRTSNTCGEGALGSQATWEFDVALARDRGVLYWDNGAQVISGALAEDGVTFTIEATVVVDMRTEETLGYPPCSIQRNDTAAGALDDPGEDVPGFSGTLSYQFAPTADSECSDLVEGEQPILAALPCAMSYKLDATRTETP